MPILEHTCQIIDQLQHENSPSLAFLPPSFPPCVPKPPEEPTKLCRAARLDHGTRQQGRAELHPRIPDRHAKTPISLQPICAAGRVTVSQPEPSPYGAKYTEEEERLNQSKGKERFRKMGSAELSSQMECKLIPFAPVSGGCRKCVRNGRWAARTTQQRGIPVCLHPEA